MDKSTKVAALKRENKKRARVIYTLAVSVSHGNPHDIMCKREMESHSPMHLSKESLTS